MWPNDVSLVPVIEGLILQTEWHAHIRGMFGTRSKQLNGVLPTFLPNPVGVASRNRATVDDHGTGSRGRRSVERSCDLINGGLC